MSIAISAGPVSRPMDVAAVAALRKPGAPRIPAGLRVQGEARYACDLALDGDLQGTLTLRNGATLLVTEQGRAEGTLCAGDAVIEGRVKGQIECAEGAVEFAPSARCTARVLYRELSIARGAEVEAELQKVGGPRG